MIEVFESKRKTDLSEQVPVQHIPLSRLRALLRDFTDLLGQQMYFWGRDVIHPEGNLLCEYGFERRKSEGLEGTSCYRYRFAEGGSIELHGACAGHYDSSRAESLNFLYIRNRKRCFLYSEKEPPPPGVYRPEALGNGPATDLYYASLRFLDWWLAYEKWTARNTAQGWRERCYEAFASLPASRPSLPPREAAIWLSQYRRNPGKIKRVRERLRSLKS
ncbi:MAG: hypothetical protein P1U85_02870 [Verrucomicrobiales bacterium]|jgi:hypothetical protein|nr:hypothetical protein [Verrucomicrobiales bacterium]